MKIHLTFKTPDVVFNATQGLMDEDREVIEELCKRWIEFGEYLTVLVDTTDKTCTVVEV